MNRFRLHLLLVLFSSFIYLLSSNLQKVSAAPQESPIGLYQITCADYTPALDSPEGYKVGTVNPDLEADLRMAIECAQNPMEVQNGVIDLDGQTVVLHDAPPAYDYDGHNGLPPLWRRAVIKNGTIERSAAYSTCDGGEGDRTEFRLFHVITINDDAVLLQNLTLKNGCASDVDSAEAVDIGGGAIFKGVGTLHLLNVHIEGNRAGQGSAIFAASEVTAVNSSYVGNTWTGSGDRGSIIYLFGLGAETTLVNNTVSQNDTGDQYILWVEDPSSSLKFINSTLVENSSSHVIGSDVLWADSSFLTVHNSILANNSGSNCISGLPGELIYSAIGSYSDDVSCNFAAYGGADNADVQLGPLTMADNGTQSYPETGGDTIDGGVDSLLPSEAELGIDVDLDGIIEENEPWTWFDQRGGWRTWAPAIDAGSYEISCADYYPGINSETGYVVGSTLSDLAADMRFAMRCAMDPPMVPVPHPMINLGGQTVTLHDAPEEYDKAGYNGLPPIWRDPFTIKNGTIERSPDLKTCDGGEGDRTEFRLLNLYGTNAITLENLTLRNGCAAEIDSNAEYDTFGGAIFNISKLYLNAVHFEGNSASSGAAMVTGNYPMIAVNSSFVDNSWNGNGDRGTILYLIGLGADATLVNSTFSQNDAADQSIIWVDDPSSSLHLINSTLADNTAAQVIATDILWATGSSINMENTILADNSGANCIAGLPGELNYSVTGSYSDDPSCNFDAYGGTDNADVQLGDLTTAVNSTQYHPLAGGDPLNGGDSTLLPLETDLGIDADHNGLIEAVPITVDQRGEARIYGPAVDAGSIEAIDFDGDGVDDDNDECPTQDASGYDADIDGCLDQISDLRVIVIELGLSKGLEKSLVTKLDNAQAALDRGNARAAVNILEAFINQVEAHRGRRINEMDADLLIAFTRNIINQIEDV